MNLRFYSRIARRIFQYRYGGRRSPAVVSYLVTYRCPHHCTMCGTGQHHQEDELTTNEALRILDGLGRAGMAKIIFTGGEPFLRDDLEQLVERCAAYGISVVVNSSGYRIESQLPVLKRLTLLRMSLDGPEVVNDLSRYEGSFEDTIRGIRLCRSENIPVALMCTISGLNLDLLEETAEIARANEVPIAFHPCGSTLLRGAGENPSQLTEEQTKSAMERLIALKRTNPYVANSYFGLRLSAREGFAHTVPCLAGRLFCRLEPDGRIKGCGWDRWSSDEINLRTMSIPEALRRIPEMQCDVCYCASRFELNVAVDDPIKGLTQHLAASAKRKSMRDLW